MSASWDAAIIGGGFFGATLATHLGARGARVLLVESRPELLTRASLVNQARVHVGYHYPRSYLTGLRSRINAPRFQSDYADCIYDRFTHYYAVGRAWSNVTAAQFRLFCERIGAPVAEAPEAVTKLFAPDLIESVVAVPEVTFDAVKLRARIGAELAEAGVEVRLGTEASRIARSGAGIALTLRDDAGEQAIEARRVFNCTYSRLNTLHAASGLPIVPLKHELAEMALVEPPAELRDAGVTVMCGPFFSMLPYPPRAGLCTFSHVRYTPHTSWQDRPGAPLVNGDAILAHGAASAFPRMVRDAARYLPAMARTRQVESLWEVKTILPRSDVDDSRPILVSGNGMTGYTCVIGSKMDNVYDMLKFVDAQPVAAAS